MDDEVQRLQLVEVEIGIEGVRYFDPKALALEPGGEDIHTLLGLMALPAPPDHQRGLGLGWRLARPGSDKQACRDGEDRGSQDRSLHGDLLHSSSRNQMFR